MKLTGWARYPINHSPLITPKTEADIRDALGEGTLIARGNGRGYGDCAVGRRTMDMRGLDRIDSFDVARGRVVAQAGVLLGDIIARCLPQGWFLRVTPGTRFVTLGGAIAADVHGKNHHRVGSFGGCVEWLELIDSRGQLVRCSPSERREMFEWTIGGMGLTGVIVRAAIRLLPVDSGWIRKRTLPAANLDEVFALFAQNADAAYSVAWVDCLARGARLGRSLVMLGEHAAFDSLPQAHRARRFAMNLQRQYRVPFTTPGVLLNQYGVRAFNAWYHRRGARQERAQLVDWAQFFYPLDSLLQWNKLYGRRGFAQFQCVIPPAHAAAGLTALLSAIADAGQGAMLAVLKLFGEQHSRFSFPMLGYTLALDFRITAKTLTLLDRLDAIAIAHHGRFYLAKDGRMSAQAFHQSDARIGAFQQMRATQNLNGQFMSAQAERLKL